MNSQYSGRNRSFSIRNSQVLSSSEVPGSCKGEAAAKASSSEVPGTQDIVELLGELNEEIVELVGELNELNRESLLEGWEGPIT